MSIDDTPPTNSGKRYRRCGRTIGNEAFAEALFDIEGILADPTALPEPELMRLRDQIVNNVEHAIPELNRQGLREFGLVTGGILAVLFGLFFPWVFGRPLPYWPWVIAGVLAAWALAAPITLRPVYRAWMRLALVLSRITTPIIMAAVYFLVITPVAFIMRLIGRDPMARRFDPNTKSYRIPIKKRSKEHMERPF